LTVHEYIIPHVLVFREHSGDDPPQDYSKTLISLAVIQILIK